MPKANKSPTKHSAPIDKATTAIIATTTTAVILTTTISVVNTTTTTTNQCREGAVRGKQFENISKGEKAGKQ